MYSDKKILLTNIKKTDGIEHIVGGVNFFPLTNNIIDPEGILINKEDFTEVDFIKAKTKDYILIYNEETNKAYYEYFDKVSEEDTTMQGKKIAILEQQVAELYFMQLQGGTN